MFGICIKQVDDTSINLDDIAQLFAFDVFVRCLESIEGVVVVGGLWLDGNLRCARLSEVRQLIGGDCFRLGELRVC